MKIGLLIIDMQKGFLTDHLKEYKVLEACEHINYVADLLRKNGHVIMHVQDIEGVDDLNQDEVHIIPQIDKHPADQVMTKRSSNAFWGTELEETLKSQQVELLITCGFSAEYCVLATYNGAIERGFKTVMLQNGLVSRHDDVITATCRDRNLISYPVVEMLCSIK